VSCLFGLAKNLDGRLWKIANRIVVYPPNNTNAILVTFNQSNLVMVEASSLFYVSNTIVFDSTDHSDLRLIPVIFIIFN